MQDDRHHLAIRLEELMTAREFSQNHLARISGVDQGTISGILNGKHTAPTWQTIQKLAAALAVDLIEFADPDIKPNPVQRRPAGRPPLRKPKKNATS